MPLAAILDTLEGTPETLHQFYKKVDDKFVLDADVESHPQVNALRNAYKSDHEKVKALTAETKKYEGIDPDRWAKVKDLSEEDLLVLERAKATERKDPTTNGAGSTYDLEMEIAKRINPMKAAHQRELEVKEAMLRQIQAEKEQFAADMKRTRIETALANACAAEGVLPGAVEEVVLFGSRFFKINDEDEVVAVDRSGTEVFGTDGKPMRPREWIQTRGVEKAHWFPYSAGGGAGGSRGSNESQIRRKADLKSVKDRVEYVKKYGQDKFLSLPE